MASADRLLAGLYFVNGLGGLIGNIVEHPIDSDVRAQGALRFVCGVMIADHVPAMAPRRLRR